VKESKQQRATRQAFERKVFVSVLRAAGHKVFEEYAFDQRPKHERRKWRFDIAIPQCEIVMGRSGTATFSREAAIALEIEGIGWGHLGVKAFRDNIQKYLEAFAQGWSVVRVTWREIGNGEALAALSKFGVSVNPLRQSRCMIQSVHDEQAKNRAPS
jgi:hypothetical protein